MHGVTGSPFLGSSIRKVCLLIKNLFSFKVAFSQAFVIFSCNQVATEKFQVSGLRWYTSDPDTSKPDNELF